MITAQSILEGREHRSIFVWPVLSAFSVNAYRLYLAMNHPAHKIKFYCERWKGGFHARNVME